MKFWATTPMVSPPDGVFVVIDTSAVIAILIRETGWEQLVAAIDDADPVLISAASVLESALVPESRFGEKGRAALDEWLTFNQLEVVPVTASQVEFARQGF